MNKLSMQRHISREASTHFVGGNLKATSCHETGLSQLLGNFLDDTTYFVPGTTEEVL